MKALLSAVEAWPGGSRAATLVPAELRSAVVQAGGLDWLPVALNLALTQVAYDGLGPVEADRLFRAHTRASFEGPILQTFVSTAVRILGLDPASFARWVPKGWHLIFRGVGEWSVEAPGPGATSVLLRLGKLPGDCADHPVWGRSVARSLDALLDQAQVSGAVALQPRAQGARELQFVMRWSGASEPAARPPVV
jgi:hypothetical protein